MPLKENKLVDSSDGWIPNHGKKQDNIQKTVIVVIGIKIQVKIQEREYRRFMKCSGQSEPFKATKPHESVCTDCEQNHWALELK